MVRPFSFLLVLTLSLSAYGQPPAKRTISNKDYDNWHSATGVTLSPDGKWIAYNWFPAEGDDRWSSPPTVLELEHRIPRAGRPAPAATSEGGETPRSRPGRPGWSLCGGAGVAGGGSPFFSPDSSKLYISAAVESRTGSSQGTEKRMLPHGLVVIDVQTGKIVERIDRVRSASIVGDKPAYLVMQMDPRPEPKEEEKPKADVKTQDGNEVGNEAENRRKTENGTQTGRQTDW
ncbi:MAG: hypothetical protein U0798_16940 [Gemmataceae bacterium]